MVHNKQTYNTKEPVKMRFRRLADGSHSIYLDYYVNGRREYEFLKLYLVPEVDSASRLINRHILQAANMIKARRVIMLVNERAGISNSTINSTMLLSDYIEQHMRESALTHRGTSYVSNCRNMRNHLRAFLGPRFGILRMKDIDARLCRNFADYLKRVKTSTGRPLSPVSVHHYFGALRCVLTAAAKEEIIADIVQGMQHLERCQIIPDRAEAIGAAMTMAKPGDVVLIAGKGHEAYQERKGVRTHFSDQETVGTWMQFHVSAEEKSGGGRTEDPVL